MFERFTEKALRVILLAQEESRRTGHNFVGTEQILLGLIAEGSGIASNALKAAGLKLSDVRREVEKITGKGSGFVSVEIPFTPRAKNILEQSLQQARAFSHSYIGTEHMLLALIEDYDGLSGHVFTKLEVNLDKLRADIYEEMGQVEDIKGLAIQAREQEIQRKIQELIDKEYEKRQDGYFFGNELDEFKRRIGSKIPDFLKGLSENELNEINDIDDYEAIRREVLRKEFDGEEFKLFFQKELNDIFGPKVEQVVAETPTLNEFTTNLSALVDEGSIDPVIGRDNEVERVIQILSRRRKNNPILIGEPGVGKTAVAEALALKIASQEIAQNLADKRISVLDVASLLAGTKYRGEFEERIKRIMDEVKLNKNMILVIDEVHTIIGAGAAEGSLDAANILKPALSRGEFQCIGATTLDEYRNIEKDPALERRFQPVYIGEPSHDETIEILKGLRKNYEMFHQVRLPDDTIKRTVDMSTTYIKDRFLPDKAIDLIDEASARVRILSTIPTGNFIVKGLEQELRAILKDKDIALRTQDYEIAARIRDREMTLRTRITALLKSQNTANIEKLRGLKFMPVVEEDDVADVISAWTGIPLTKIGAAEAEKLLRMEQELHERVIGQEEAVTKISNAVKRSRVGISSSDRPIASFLFCGPTGVGKTELTKALGEYYFGSEQAIVRLDMSEFMEKHTVSRLIGSPPGYVGYQEGGQLTEAVRRRPFSLILFDEVEKAHPDVFNLLLQVLDDGRLSDSKGKVIDFTNTIIIMTSNLGSKHIDSHLTEIKNENDENNEQKEKQAELGSSLEDFNVKPYTYQSYLDDLRKDIEEKQKKLDSLDLEHESEMQKQFQKDIESFRFYEEVLEEVENEEEIEDDTIKVEKLVMGEIKNFFRPEFINRIDDIIIFHKLRKSDVKQILEILIRQLSKRLRKKNSVLYIDDSAKQVIIDEGYDPAFGARPLRRALQHLIEDGASKKILETPLKTLRRLIYAEKDEYFLPRSKDKKSTVKVHVLPLPSFVLSKYDKDIIDSEYNEKAIEFYINLVKDWIKDTSVIEKKLGEYYKVDMNYLETTRKEELAVNKAIEDKIKELTKKGFKVKIKEKTKKK
jgi:ATP-dependent Clp protease ATP-binding subunit ClpC